MIDAIPKIAAGAPKDDGLKSRKFRQVVWSSIAIFTVAALVLGFSTVMYYVRAPAVCAAPAIATATAPFVTFAVWADFIKWIFTAAIVGYGGANVFEKYVLTRNGKPKP